MLHMHQFCSIYFITKGSRGHSSCCRGRTDLMGCSAGPHFVAKLQIPTPYIYIYIYIKRERERSAGRHQAARRSFCTFQILKSSTPFKVCRFADCNLEIHCKLRVLQITISKYSILELADWLFGSCSGPGDRTFYLHLTGGALDSGASQADLRIQ